MSELTTSMSVPLDSDGFLRRECPTCEREFKWFPSPEGDGKPAPDGGYYCPYCHIQAPSNAWLTQAQVELARNVAIREFVSPQLDEIARGLRRASQGSGGFLTMDMRFDKPAALDPLVETDDMRRVEFGCHPTEPIKVLDNWDRQVFCLICSMAAESA